MLCGSHQEQNIHLSVCVCVCAKHMYFLSSVPLSVVFLVFESDLWFNTKFTFSIKLNGVTVGLTEAPWTVEDRSSLCNVDL